MSATSTVVRLSQRMRPGALCMLLLAMACTGGSVASSQPNTASAPLLDGSTPDAAGSNKNPEKSPAAPAPGSAAESNITSPQPPAAPQAIGPQETSSADDGNFVIGPNYSRDANMDYQAGVAQGTWCTFVAPGDTSLYYTGQDANLKQSFSPINRKVYVYLPAGYAAGEVLPFIVGNDGSQAKGYFSHVLDNLIAQKALPRMAAVCVDNGGGDAFGSERGLEYDVVSGTYGEFINNEILPLATQNCHVTFTADAAGRGAFGTSSGGAAAMSMGWFHPELYARIITYSATLVSQWPTPQEPNGAWAYPGHLFADTPKKNLRIYLNVGSNDLGANRNNTKDWVLANTTAASKLAERGYHYQFYFAQGGNHVDQRVVDATLPAALVWAWRGYGAN